MASKYNPEYAAKIVDYRKNRRLLLARNIAFQGTRAAFETAVRAKLTKPESAIFFWPPSSTLRFNQPDRHMGWVMIGFDDRFDASAAEEKLKDYHFHDRHVRIDRASRVAYKPEPSNARGTAPQEATAPAGAATAGEASAPAVPTFAAPANSDPAAAAAAAATAVVAAAAAAAAAASATCAASAAINPSPASAAVAEAATAATAALAAKFAAAATAAAAMSAATAATAAADAARKLSAEPGPGPAAAAAPKPVDSGVTESSGSQDALRWPSRRSSASVDSWEGYQSNADDDDMVFLDDSEEGEL